MLQGCEKNLECVLRVEKTTAAASAGGAHLLNEGLTPLPRRIFQPGQRELLQSLSLPLGNSITNQDPSSL